MRRPEVYRARKLRRSLTLPEVLLWDQLRASKQGAKFRRQHPVGPYIADFYCSVARLVVEVDGEAHNRGRNPARDKARDQYLTDKGFKLLRIAASDVLKNMEDVVQAVRAAIENPLHHACGMVPLPASREDLQ